MSFLSRLLGTAPDPKDALRPLWHAVVTEARRPAWYAQHGVADTVDGRFDMILAVMALVILRLERNPERVTDTARLTELFVDDMDGQLRQQGIGDPALGKRMGKIVAAAGGRIGAFRDARAGERSLTDVVEKNVTLTEGSDPQATALAFEQLAGRLDGLSEEDVMAGNIAP
ncbi:ubiquinol-cytochrome C chaperone family protein [Qipengyuania sp. JC766]|uniref:ubiquinol-cytochrome C chaperone family protein n=1 Tax=Qipengyuania sp. JC766 TaxID=3232139 RepID=UPI00345A3689